MSDDNSNADGACAGAILGGYLGCFGGAGIGLLFAAFVGPVRHDIWEREYPHFWPVVLLGSTILGVLMGALWGRARSERGT